MRFENSRLDRERKTGKLKYNQYNKNLKRLAMRDPIKAFEEIKNSFKLYVKTRFATRFESIEKEREEILDKEGFFINPLILN